MKIRTISVWQPWATLMVLTDDLRKRHETRSDGFWRVNASRLRPGDLLAIQAGKEIREGHDFLLQRSPASVRVHAALRAGGYRVFGDLAFGAVVGLVRFVAAHQTEHRRACVSDDERAFGAWADGRWALETDLVLRLPEPIPARGAQGVWWWDVPAEVEAMLEAASCSSHTQ